jgi:hypothetical protein
VQGGDHGDAVRDHLLRLLGGGALPHAERTGGLASNGGRDGHRAVHEELSRFEHVAQIVQVLGLGAKRDRQEDDRPASRGVVIDRPLGLGGRLGASQPLGGLARPLGAAGADDHGQPGSGQAHSQAPAERARAADDRDWLRHAAAAYAPSG